MNRWHVDPAHAWLEVSEAELSRLGIRERISSYSYRHAGRAYLEEDRDAGIYLRAIAEREGSDPRTAAAGFQTVTYRHPAPLRGFCRFAPTTYGRTRIRPHIA